MRWLLSVTAMFLCAISFAQPSNDDCANALNVLVSPTEACSNAVSSTTVGATASGLAGCLGTAEDDVWFKFTATQTAHPILLTGLLVDPVIELFSGTCGALTSLKCSDKKLDNSHAQDLFDNLTIGTEYYVRVYDKAANSIRAAVTLCVFNQLTNDECTGAITVPVNTDTSWALQTSGNLQFATATDAHCAAGRTNHGDLWYKFVATGSTHLLLGILPVSNSQLGFIMQAYDGSCGTLTPMLLYAPSSTNGLACRSFNDGYLVLRNLTPGNTYYLRAMYDNTRYTSTQFSFAISNPTANDECTNAINVPLNSGNNCVSKTRGDYKNATGSSNTGCSSGFEPDVWFKFTATATRHMVSVDFLSSTSRDFEVLRNTCGSFVSVYCGSGFVTTREVADLTGLNPGEEYYIRIINITDASLDEPNPFDICITTPGTGVTNDNCINAITLSTNPGEYSVSSFTGATGVQESPPSCSAGTIDVWYQFTAPYNAHAGITLWPSENNYTSVKSLTAFNGSCGALNYLACNTPPATYPPNPTLVFDVTAGQTYFIRAAVINNSTRTGPLVLELTSLNALPVTLGDFRISKITDKSIGLSWQTTDESKIRAYYIQRSNDGSIFTDIGSVEAKNTPRNEYAFTDNQPVPGRNYYRLRIVDIDDKAEYSKIIDAGLKGSGNFHVYAAGTTLRILNDKNASVQASLTIYDGTGRNLRSRQLTLKPGANTITDLQLTKGSISFVHLDTPDGSQVFKIIW